MIISFFEEFPTNSNLKKLSLVTWPTKLYLAASSLKEFERIAKPLRKNKRIKEIVYWPTLQKKEGYWISPFSSRKALQRVLDELEGKRVPVMLDLELPTRQNSLLYLSFQFGKNKKLLSSFIKTYSGNVYMAEYAHEEPFLKHFGLDYPSPQVYVIKMLYRSLHQYPVFPMKHSLETEKRRYGHHFLPAFGLLAPGIHGHERCLSPQELLDDLRTAKQMGISEAIIFRLGGLNRAYQKAIQAL